MEHEIDIRFQYHKPKEWQPEVYQSMRDQAKEFAMEIEVNCPDSREKSIAMTKLEEAVMWANASIARRS